MIELFERDIHEQGRQSSKGNQLKWNSGRMWYKADYTGYEGLAEYMISGLLLHSTLGKTEFAIYEPEQIRYKSVIYNGVKSPDFLKDGWQIITLERLYKNCTGQSLTEVMWHISEAEDRMKFLVDEIVRLTGLSDFGKYLNKLFTIDAIFLNEDRHLHNVAVLMDGAGNFDLCPIFDNGAGLLSDETMDYPLGGDVYELMDSVQAKTVSMDFDEQLEISEQLYGMNLHFSFTKKDVCQLLDALKWYSAEEKDRVQTVITYRMKKYGYLFE